MDRKYHLFVTIFLVSSILTLQLMASGMVKKERDYEMPGYQGIDLNESNRTVYLDSFTLEQKIAFMTESWQLENGSFTEEEMIGGLHLGGLGSKESYKETISNYKSDRPIEPLISMDMEGCGNPLSSFMESHSLAEINTSGEAMRLGEKHGRNLRSIGVDMNYAPVLDLEDTIWECRSFKGGYRDVAEKGCSYIEGLQSEGVMATAKHFPGNTLEGKDPHNKVKNVNITAEDLHPFERAVSCNASAIMISHQSTSGVIDTGGKPASVSGKVVEKLRDEYGFQGLIVTDAVNMRGLDNYYDNKSQKYVDLFRAGNDFILKLSGDKAEKAEMIDTVAQAIRDGELSEEKVDRSVTRLLNARGWNVVDRTENESIHQAINFPSSSDIHSLKE